MSMSIRKSVTIKALALAVIITMATCATLPLYVSAVEEESVNEMKRISFEEGEQSAQINLCGNQAIVVTGKANTEGSKALKVNFIGGNSNGIEFTPIDGVPWDIGDTACLSFSAYNVMKVDKEVLIKFNLLDPNTNSPSVCAVKANLTSGKQGIYSTALDITSGGNLAIRNLPSMQSEVKSVTYISGVRKISGYKITKITFSVPNNTESTKILFDNIQILNDGTTTALNLYNAVDKYGQNTHQEWVGKVRNDQDLIDSDAGEQIALDARLAELARNGDRTQYGGWKNEAYKQAATGRFYTKKIGNEWTFIDPEGYPYFATGLDILRVEDMNTWVVGREPMFENLPDEDSSLGDHFMWLADCAVSPLSIPGGIGYNFYTANLERKYGDDYLQKWKQNALKRFKAWGFTTIGCWADPALFFGKGETSKLPYVANGWIRGNHSMLPWGNNIWQNNADPFDPEFRVSVENMAEQVKATGVNQDPWCIGIYVDNEMDLGMNTNALAKNIMAYTDSRENPVYAKLAVIEFLKQKYNNSIVQLNASWGSNINNWDELKAPYGGPMGDMAEIVGLWADKYYGTVAEVINEKLPNLMYFGSRIANFGCSESIVKSCARHVDVVSFNSYDLVGPKDWMYLGSFDKPVLIGEFSFSAKDKGQFGVGGVPVSECRFRGHWYQNYMNAVLDSSKFVGAQWFQYYDQPILGRAWDGENSNVGFVDVTDQPYDELVDNAAYINKTMYERKFLGTIVPPPALPPAYPVVPPVTKPALPLENPEDPLEEGQIINIVIALNQSTAAINAATNTNLQLTATVTPVSTLNKNVIWSSSNASVATVDNTGKVTAIANGTVTITAKSEANPSAQATCVITVTGFAQTPINTSKISFEANENLGLMSTYNGAATQFTTQGVSDGARAMLVNVGTLDANYGGVKFDITDPMNWGSNATFKAYLTNPNNQDIQIRFDIGDTSNNVRTYYYTLSANTSRTITIANLGPQTGNYSDADGWWGAENGINTQQIDYFKVYLWEQRPNLTANTFVIDNIEVRSVVNSIAVSFETNENLGLMSTYSGAATQFTTQGVSDGARAMLVNAGTLDANYGGVKFDITDPMNWGSNATFKAYLTNPNNQDIQIRFDIGDTSNNVRTYYYTLSANTSRTITIANLGPQTGNYSGADGWWGAENGINTQQIDYFKVYLWEQRPNLTVNTFIIDNIIVTHE